MRVRNESMVMIELVKKPNVLFSSVDLRWIPPKHAWPRSQKKIPIYIFLFPWTANSKVGFHVFHKPGMDGLLTWRFSAEGSGLNVMREAEDDCIDCMYGS